MFISCMCIPPVAATLPEMPNATFFPGFSFSPGFSMGNGESGVIAAGLIVVSTPSGGDVYVDGAMLGRTPCTLPGLPAGVHIVTIRMNGYKDWPRAVRIRDRHTVNLNASLLSSDPIPCRTIVPTPTLPHPSVTPLGTPVPVPTRYPFITPGSTLIHPSITPLGTPIPVPAQYPYNTVKPTLTRPSNTPLGTPIPVPTKPGLIHPSVTPLGTSVHVVI
jgi:hypothetical protein